MGGRETMSRGDRTRFSSIFGKDTSSSKEVGVAMVVVVSVSVGAVGVGVKGRGLRGRSRGGGLGGVDTDRGEFVEGARGGDPNRG